MSAKEMNFGGRFHMDDRGIRYCDIFPEIEKGDINVSIIEPGAAALWHRHMHQDDYQIVVKGSLKVGICNTPYMENDDLEGYGLPEDQAASIYEQREEEFINWQQLKEKFIDNTEIEEKYENWPDDEPQCVWHSLSERNASHGPLFIPRYLWHGCYNYTNEQAILIYHITNKYDGNDEERMHPLIAGWRYEREVK